MEVDLSITVREHMLATMRAKLSPLLLETGAVMVSNVVVIDKDNDVVEVTLLVDNMLRSGVRLADALKRPSGTRTLRRSRINVNSIAGTNNGNIGWLYTGPNYPSTSEVLAFVNEYLETDVKSEDIDWALSRPRGNLLYLKISDHSPFYKGYVQITLLQE